MAKKRIISKSSLTIIKLLKKKVSSGKMERMGFSRSTIRYYKYKLFKPEKYQEVLRKVNEYNKATYAKRKRTTK